MASDVTVQLFIKGGNIPVCFWINLASFHALNGPSSLNEAKIFLLLADDEAWSCSQSEVATSRSPPAALMKSRVLMEVRALSGRSCVAEPYLSSRQADTDICLTSFSLWWSSFTTRIDLMRLSISRAMHTTKNTPAGRGKQTLSSGWLGWGSYMWQQNFLCSSQVK